MILDYKNYYLVGIKGVAMTSTAQILHDAGKRVAGSDVEEEFVTQEILDKLPIKIDLSFDQPLPPETECLIYTSAHQAAHNPQVKEAQEKQIPIYSQAEAIADLFNQQPGLAVCGVGGKSTTSAMLAWIVEKTGKKASYSVGVGNIPGLEKTGQWQAKAECFVIEADEYVTNPLAAEDGEKITPRFSYLKPQITVCTNLKYDHPDVYNSFADTQRAYAQLFNQTSETLIINYQDLEIVQQLPNFDPGKIRLLTFGKSDQADIRLTNYQSQVGQAEISYQLDNQEYQLSLKVPGEYNAMNALAAILAAREIGVEPNAANQVLTNFNSTKRRFELIGQKNGVTYYDDYAHHPHEVEAVIKTINDWYPQQKVVIAFQSHTFSRTKRLFDEFVDSFAQAKEVVMIDIFSSAREKKDSSVSSTLLCQAIQDKHSVPAQNLETLQNLAEYCRAQLKAEDVLMTVGAGDIYHVHEMI